MSVYKFIEFFLITLWLVNVNCVFRKLSDCFENSGVFEQYFHQISMFHRAFFNSIIDKQV